MNTLKQSGGGKKGQITIFFSIFSRYVHDRQGVLILQRRREKKFVFLKGQMMNSCKRSKTTPQMKLVKNRLKFNFEECVIVSASSSIV